MPSLLYKSIVTVKNEGMGAFFKKATVYSFNSVKKVKHKKCCRDVLFINGCAPNVPHPSRYRVTHQRDQLSAFNVSNDEVFYTQLTLDMLRFYRLFVFFRCPYTEMVGDFIRQAKKLNKTVIFDIDDLVIDTKYTDTIRYVAAMKTSDRKLYDDGVTAMGKTLSLCEAAITTTERLAAELEHYVPEVFINRNTASERMLELSEAAVKQKNGAPRNDGKIRIGYFSGSITHNEDFEMILPVIARIMDEYNNVELHIVGELDVPDQLSSYKSRIFSSPFVNWQKLPQLLASVDINLAPLTNSIFNEAKSENKWVEAALVKVPTVASNIGAFAKMIDNDQTGLLCSAQAEWDAALKKLIESQSLREEIASRAYDFCIKSCVTTYAGMGLAEFIMKKMKPNIVMVLPSLAISGGVRVAVKHAEILQEAGYDVSLLSGAKTPAFFDTDNGKFPALPYNEYKFQWHCDNGVSTLWATVEFLEKNSIAKRFYLVQNFETDFYPANHPWKSVANASYCPFNETHFITISTWCRSWLAEHFHKQAKYAPNGLDRKQFWPLPRCFNGKIRVLIEGDSESYYKNVDESFRIVEELDKTKYEIWYMSYNGKAKDNYRVDKFLHKVPFEQVSDVYRQCHILLKSSILESFSYPPLEMMSTGGFAVVAPNAGNAEYLVDGENCLLYEQGNIDAAVKAIERICNDEELRQKLYDGGQKTAENRDWVNFKEQILDLYK